MRHIPRIYFQDLIISTGHLLKLSISQSIHINVVLRKKEQDKVIVFNEKQGAFLGHIEKISKGYAIFIDQFLNEAEKLKPLVVGVPLIKNRGFGNVLDLATQLGCTKLVPITFDYSQIPSVSLVKMSRQVIISVEQSGRCTVPIIKPMSLEEFVYQHNFILCANERSNNHINVFKDIIEKQDAIAILVGPEGGFSQKEQEFLSFSPIFNIGLGNLILRSEVAVACILSQVKVFY